MPVDDDDEDQCIICYSERSMRGAGAAVAPSPLVKCACSLALCERCWVDECKMLCPVCQREELNAKRICHICGDTYHVRDIDSCDVCSLGTCRACRAENERRGGRLHYCALLHVDGATPAASSLDDAAPALDGEAIDALSSFAFCPVARVVHPSGHLDLRVLRDEMGDVGYTLIVEAVRGEGNGDLQRIRRVAAQLGMGVEQVGQSAAASAGYAFAVRQVKRLAEARGLIREFLSLIVVTSSTGSHS